MENKDKLIKQEKEFYDEIMNNLDLIEKNFNSKISKNIVINNEKYKLTKYINSNVLYIEKENEGFLEYYLGKTTFKENNSNNKDFIPVGLNHLKYFLESKINCIFYYLNENENVNLDESAIIDLCRKGNNKIIIYDSLNFTNDLNENLFNTKKTKKDYQNLTLKDLSIYYLHYFSSIESNNNDFVFNYTTERQKFYSELTKKILTVENKPIDLYGTFGIGKSTSLLAFQKSEINMRSAYFNLNTLFNLKDKNILMNLILYESMTLCNEYSEFILLKDNIMKKKDDNIWDIIKEIIIIFSTEYKP